MRANVAVLFAIAITIAALRAFSGCSTSADETPRTGTELDCVWVQDQANCWHAMLAAVDECLGHGDGGIDVGVGALAGDRRSCSYPTGREVVAGGFALDLLGPSGEDPKQRDFEVRLGGRLCSKVHQAGDSLTITAPNGTLRYERVGNDVSLTCPDGKTYKGNILGLIGCLAPQLGVPGYAWQAADASAYFTLLGLSAPLFSCQLPPPGSGADAGPAVDAADVADGGAGD